MGRYKGERVQGQEDARVGGHKGKWVQGHKAERMQGQEDVRAGGHKGGIVQGLSPVRPCTMPLTKHLVKL